MNKKYILLIAIIIGIIILASIFIINKLNDNTEKNENKISATETSKKKEETEQTNVKEENVEKDNNKEEGNTMYSTGKHNVNIKIKNYGTIELELDADVAPITVANFAKLVNEGFYNGLTFHRIIDGFMIQGGDPLGNGTGGSDENIKGEFAVNGVKNTISHVRGTISMARASDYNSASSQFFIVHEDSEFLDGQYAGFGKVTKGIEIVDKICEDTQVQDSNGTVLSKNQPVIEEITMVD